MKGDIPRRAGRCSLGITNVSLSTDSLISAASLFDAHGASPPRAHLWIHSCEWNVRFKNGVIGDWTTPRRIDRAARELNGQKLQHVAVNQRSARTLFVFDLGAELETKPYDRSSEQWLLYEPDGRVLVWRADRKYQYGRSDRSPQQLRWRRLAG